MSRIWNLIPAFILVITYFFMAEIIKNNAKTISSILIIIASIFAAASAWNLLIRKPKNREKRLKSLLNDIKCLGGTGLAYGKASLYTETGFKSTENELESSLITLLAMNGINKHEKILRRKKSQMIYFDDYGKLITKNWDKECRDFVKNVLFPLDFSLSPESGIENSNSYLSLSDMSRKSIVELWASLVDETVEDNRWNDYGGAESRLTGHEYEVYVAEIISSCGWDSSVTKGSGDHGADVIAEKDDVRIAIQCKYYSTPVGNKSVQEAYSAKGFYDCDYACVVTNSSYTPAAKKAAAKLGVSLLHHDDLGEYLSDQD